MTRRRGQYLFVAAALVCALASSTARAQSADAQPQPPQSQGPMQLERIHNGFVIAPELKVADIDRSTGELAGGHAAWLFDNHLLIGGAGYGLTHRRDSVNSLGYGGALIGWQSELTNWLGFDVKGLVGGGRATLTTSYADLFTPIGRDRHPIPISVRDRIDRLIPPNARFRFREDFFVFEPQADLLLRVTKHVGVSVGAGYRVIGNADGVARRLRGASGSVAVRLTGGNQ